MQMLVVASVLPSLMLMSRTRVYPILRMGGAVFPGLASTGWIAERLFGVQTPVNLIVNALARHALLIAVNLLVVSFACRLSAHVACSANGRNQTRKRVRQRGPDQPQQHRSCLVAKGRLIGPGGRRPLGRPRLLARRSRPAPRGAHDGAGARARGGIAARPYCRPLGRTSLAASPSVPPAARWAAACERGPRAGIRAAAAARCALVRSKLVGLWFPAAAGGPILTCALRRG